MLTTKTITQSIEMLMAAMSHKDRVFFTRFGDNDIMQLTGTDMFGTPLNSRPLGGNKTIFSTELQKELQQSISIQDADYFIALSLKWNHEKGMEPGLFQSFGYNKALERKVKRFIAPTRVLIPVLFHYLIVFQPELFDFFINQYIRDRKILFIGSNDKKVVEKVVGKLGSYVKTPEYNAYDQIDKWYPKVEKAIKNGCDVVIPTCGQASRVVGGRLWNSGAKVHSVDMGSLFDAVEGKQSRTWIKMKGEEIKQRYNDTH